VAVDRLNQVAVLDVRFSAGLPGITEITLP